MKLTDVRLAESESTQITTDMFDVRQTNRSTGEYEIITRQRGNGLGHMLLLLSRAVNPSRLTLRSGRFDARLLSAAEELTNRGAEVSEPFTRGGDGYTALLHGVKIYSGEDILTAPIIQGALEKFIEVYNIIQSEPVPDDE